MTMKSSVATHLTSTGWDIPSTEDMDGFLSDNSEIGQPQKAPAGNPATLPDTLLSRASSKNSGLASRGSSKRSAAMMEAHRALEVLSSFRTQLASSQRQTLQLLDSELEKVRRLHSSMPAERSQSNSPPRRSLLDQRADHMTTPKDFRLRLPGALNESRDELNGSKEIEDVKQVKTEGAPVKRGSGEHPHSLVTISLPAAAMKQRKRRMSWIHKSSAEDLAKLELADEEELEKEANIAYVSKDDKDKAKRDGNEALNPGLLSKLNGEVAKESIRNKAADDFARQASISEQILKEEGALAHIAQHPLFEKITMSVIFFNAIWIGIDIEFNHADILAEADPGFILVENFFCCFFFGELVLRYLIYTKTYYALRDIWFLFDFFLLILMVVETWVMPLVHLFSEGPAGAATGGISVLRVARIMRVLRTARMARLVRLMPELMILVKGMMVAFRSVFFTLLLLMLVTYVFSVAFMQFGRGTALEETFFNSMGTAISTLMLKCVLTDQEAIIMAVAQESWIMATLLIVFILVGSLTVMNMLLGVLVEAIKTVSMMEREQLEVDFAKKVLWDVISKGEADSDGDNKISEEEFMKVLRKPEAVMALTSLGVDVEAALDYGKLLFEDGEPLTFGEFMRCILTLRGSNQTTVKDIVDLRKFTADEFSQVHELLASIGQYLDGHAQIQGSQPDMPMHPAIVAHSASVKRHSFASRSSTHSERGTGS